MEKKCVLIIDDDSTNRESVKNIFEGIYSFVEAESAARGLRLINDDVDKYAAVFLDTVMTDMEAPGLLELLNERGITERVPTFLITAKETSELCKHAYELGVVDVIGKPAVPHVVRRRVQSAVELFELRDKLSRQTEEQEEQLNESAEIIDELHRTTIEVLASAIEHREVESGAHTRRMYDITKYILSNTSFGDGFTEDEINNIAIGSILHDVGKIAISDIVLNKPGKLTEHEYNYIKQHTVKGAAILEELIRMRAHPSYEYAVDIALHHHERWDGGGYPDGLSGEEITPWAQVVAIADVYDAMMTPRVYKPSIDADAVLKAIVSGECGAFNPKLIECFLEAEPELRSWYSDIQAGDGKSVEPVLHDASDLVLLSVAIESAFDMVMCVNLTQNNYYVVDHDRLATHIEHNDGVFDELIENGANFVPKSHRDLFVKTFSRENLLSAYENGKKTVALTHPQCVENGEVRYVVTTVIFFDDPRNGDVREITLSRYLDNTHVELSID